MESVSVPSRASRDPDPEQEHRVLLTTKRRAAELMSRASELLRSALDGQPELSEESRALLLRELTANFEAAVRLNVLVDGKPWDEAPDLEDEEALDLESLLDDGILETSRRRRCYPHRILPHVVHALKAERRILSLYRSHAQPEDLQKLPDHGGAMEELSAAAPGVVRQAIHVIKSISVLRQQADGLCQILAATPSSASRQIHREVLGSAHRAAGGAARRPAKRAVEEAAAAGYAPDAKRPERSEDGHQGATAGLG